MQRASFALLFALSAFTVVAVAEDTLHLYNWSDYVAEDTLSGFEAETGIRPRLDVYDSNEVLEAKLFAGQSGYDLVFPTARPFAARHLKAGLYLPLDKTKLTGLDRLDPAIMSQLASIDPDNAHIVPYMWGTSGLGVNRDKVQAALGEAADLDTWALIFDPDTAAKLGDCGISLLDDPTEVFSAALAYLGKDPNSLDKADLDAASALIKAVYPHVRYFHSSQYMSDLANGDLCVAMGYSGDVFQAQSRAEEAGKGVVIDYLLPREGAAVWIDVMAIPKDAPNPDAAHAFIAYMLQPGAIAAVSNAVYYANANLEATPLLDEEVREDPTIYPPAEVKARLFAPSERSDREIRELNRLWTRLKANR
ncbi:Putrescine-binding periplasmic protein precursor potF; Periplasmic ABC transporter, polyamine-binding protein [Thiocapsa sp. KS1]|nr:polyamine ABC transporter substrate-binding protein [Thiocapsa sp. KS1]CRI67401.1 Putrescine-binding periplasmic protein precursor potF; Periplasmic ABC transporter, polyamine-binding protein [Thiocapsa sp. KS1]